MRRPTMIVMTIAGSMFIAGDAGAGSVSNTLNSIGSALQTSAKKSARTAPPSQSQPANAKTGAVARDAASGMASGKRMHKSYR